MTNPYTPPKDGGGLQSSGSTPRLFKQCLSSAVTGVVLAGCIVSLPVQLMGPPSLFRTVIEIQVGIVLLIGIIEVHAWSCRGLLQLLTASTAATWGTLLTYSLLVSIFRGIFPVWTDFGLALLILPAVLTLVGWPVMYIAQRRRLQRLTSQSLGDHQ